MALYRKKRRMLDGPCKINTGPHRLDLASNILIVDFSYLTFSRYYAMRVWYKASVAPELPEDCCADQVFMDKYKATYFARVYAFCKEKKIPKSNVIYVLDCPHVANWRVITGVEYKATRAESHARQGFTSFEIFGLTRNTLLATEQESQGNLVFYHPNLEADDVVALLTRHLNGLSGFNANIYIMASDRDYVQICERNVYLYDIAKKPISSLLTAECSAQDFLIRKILIGDCSDNIESCMISREAVVALGLPASADYMKCTERMIGKLFASGRVWLYQVLDDARRAIAELPEPEYEEDDARLYMPITPFSTAFKDNRFIYNARMIDFRNIPMSFQREMEAVFATVIPV